MLYNQFVNRIEQLSQNHRETGMSTWGLEDGLGTVVKFVKEYPGEYGRCQGTQAVLWIVLGDAPMPRLWGTYKHELTHREQAIGGTDFSAYIPIRAGKAAYMTQQIEVDAFMTGWEAEAEVLEKKFEEHMWDKLARYTREMTFADREHVMSIYEAEFEARSQWTQVVIDLAGLDDSYNMSN